MTVECGQLLPYDAFCCGPKPAYRDPEESARVSTMAYSLAQNDYNDFRANTKREPNRSLCSLVLHCPEGPRFRCRVAENAYTVIRDDPVILPAAPSSYNKNITPLRRLGRFRLCLGQVEGGRMK